MLETFSISNNGNSLPKGDIDYGRFICKLCVWYGRRLIILIVNQIEELAKFTAGIGRLEGFQSKVEGISQPKYK